MANGNPHQADGEIRYIAPTSRGADYIISNLKEGGSSRVDKNAGFRKTKA